MLWLATGFLQRGWAQTMLPPVTWESLGPGAVPARVADLAADPRNDSILHLAAPGGGIWRSSDRGSNWVSQLDSTPSLQICSLALDPVSPDLLYAGTGDDQSPRPAQGVARSTDSGFHWTVGPRFTNRPVCALAVDPTNGRRVLAGSAEGLFLSGDFGDSWRKVLSYPVTSLSFDRQGVLYVGMLGANSLVSRDNLLARSTDGGLTWTILPLPANPAASATPTAWISVSALGAGAVGAVVSYRNPLSSRLLLDYYRSTDDGTSWTLSSAIGDARQRVKLFADPRGGSLYLLGATTLLASGNQGVTWRPLVTRAGPFNAGAFTAGSLLLAGEKGLELVPPPPGASTGVIPGPPIGQFLQAASDANGTPWAAGPAGLFGMLSSPADWKRAISDVPMGTVAAGETSTQDIILAGGNATVYHSGDGGAQFSSIAVIPTTELRAPFPPLVLDPLNAGIAYVAGQNLYRTDDSGVTWSALPAAIDPDPARVVIAMAIAPAGRRFMYVATACLPEAALVSCPDVSAVWRSQNSGQSWTQVSRVPGLVNRLAVDPRQSNTVYAAIGAFAAGPSVSAGINPGDLLRSTDGGASWLSIRANLPRVPTNTVVIDPSSLPTQFNMPAQTLYIGSDAGVFVSFNAGAQWTDISQGLPSSPITHLSLRVADHTLLATTFGRGVYRASAAGFGASLVATPLSVGVTLNVGATATAGVALLNVSTSRLDWQLAALDSWLSVPAPNGRLDPRASSEAGFRVSAAGLQVGTYKGRLRLTAGQVVQNLLVTLQVMPPPGRMTILSGNNATGTVGTALAPLEVLVQDADLLPLAGVPVSFAVAGGGGSLSPRTDMTDAAGKASTVLTLPNTPGAVKVVAAAGDVSVTFTAMAVQLTRPALLTGSVVNGATFLSGAPLAPGSIVSIFGQNLAETSGSAPALPLPQLLQTTRVLLTTPGGDILLPLFYVSPEQVNAQLPLDVPPGVYKLSVEVATVRGNAVEISIAAFAPGIFTLSEDGRGQGIFVKTDGSLTTAGNPATRGAVVTFYATGLGAVDPPVAAGQPGAATEPLNRTVQRPRVFFDIYEAEVLYSGLAPGFAGLYQVNARVPTRVSPASNLPVSLTVGGAASNRVTIPVQ